MFMPLDALRYHVIEFIKFIAFQFFIIIMIVWFRIFLEAFYLIRGNFDLFYKL